jgi:hypothetical protein
MMESSWLYFHHGSTTPDPAARAALAGAAARARLADRVVSPWWFHGGLAAAVLLAYVSISFRFASHGFPWS